MRDHLQDGALEALRAEYEDAEGDETHVRDRRIGDQLLHVRLDQRNQPDVDDRDQRQRDHEAGQFVTRVRHDRQRQPQETVAAQLQHDGRQNDRAAGRGFDVRVGQPGMHRPHRNLDRKGDHERHEDEYLHAERQRHFIEAEERKTASRGVEKVDQRDQRQERSHQGVEKELDRRIHAVGPAPHADDDEHGDQRRLEKHVEQQCVERAKDTVHQPRQYQERGHVLRDALFDHFPPGEHHQHGGQAVEQDQQQRHAVDAEVVIYVEARDPRREFLKLEVSRRAVELRPQRQRDNQAGHRADQREHARSVRLPVTHDEHHAAGDDRHPDDEGQNRIVHSSCCQSKRYSGCAEPRVEPNSHTDSSKRMPMIMANA